MRSDAWEWVEEMGLWTHLFSYYLITGQNIISISIGWEDQTLPWSHKSTDLTQNTEKRQNSSKIRHWNKNFLLKKLRISAAFLFWQKQNKNKNPKQIFFSIQPTTVLLIHQYSLHSNVNWGFLTLFGVFSMLIWLSYRPR